MNINDILTLANAGFSKDEITKLAAVTPTLTPAPAPAPTPIPVWPQQPPMHPSQTPVWPSAQTHMYSPAPAPAPAPTSDDSINQMLAEMSLLRQDIQQNNILNSQQPKVETTDDIIAKIINPPKKEGNK